MSFIAGVKGLIGLGSSGEKIVDTGLGLVGMGAKGIDVLFHTDEEKTQEAMQSRSELFKHAIEMNRLFNQSNTESSKARRLLAFAIAGYTFLAASFCMAVLTLGYLSDEIELNTAKLLVSDLVTIIDKFYLGEAFAAVLATFFVYHGFAKFGRK